MKKAKRTVAMVGYSPTTRDLVPWDEDVEVWTLNHGHSASFIKRMDYVFEIHPIGYLKKNIGTSQNDREHWEWLTQPHGDIKIIMHDHFPEIPNSVKFDHSRAVREFGNFFTSSLAFMIAQALMEEIDRIEIYGFDMKSDSEYNYQRDSAEYFIGLAMGKGVDVYLPPECNLLKGKIYAFNDNSIGLRQKMEIRIWEIMGQVENNLAEYQMADGIVMGLEKYLPTCPELEELMIQKQQEAIIKRDVLQLSSGAEQEAREMLKLFDAYYNLDGGIMFDARKKDGGSNDGTEK